MTYVQRMRQRMFMNSMFTNAVNTPQQHAALRGGTGLERAVQTNLVPPIASADKVVSVANSGKTNSIMNTSGLLRLQTIVLADGLEWGGSAQRAPYPASTILSEEEFMMVLARPRQRLTNPLGTTITTPSPFATQTLTVRANSSDGIIRSFIPGIRIGFYANGNNNIGLVTFSVSGFTADYAAMNAGGVADFVNTFTVRLKKANEMQYMTLLPVYAQEGRYMPTSFQLLPDAAVEEFAQFELLAMTTPAAIMYFPERAVTLSITGAPTGMQIDVMAIAPMGDIINRIAASIRRAQ